MAQRKKMWGALGFAITLILALLELAAKNTPAVAVSLLLSIAGCLFYAAYAAGYLSRARLSVAERMGRLVLVGIVVGVIAATLGRFVWPEPKTTPQPRVALPTAPPGSLRVGINSENKLKIQEGKIITIPKGVTPCVTGRTAYGLDALPLLPGGMSYKKPWLLAMPRRLDLPLESVSHN